MGPRLADNDLRDLDDEEHVPPSERVVAVPFPELPTPRARPALQALVAVRAVARPFRCPDLQYTYANVICIYARFRFSFIGSARRGALYSNLHMRRYSADDGRVLCKQQTQAF